MATLHARRHAALGRAEKSKEKQGLLEEQKRFWKKGPKPAEKQKTRVLMKKGHHLSLRPCFVFVFLVLVWAWCFWFGALLHEDPGYCAFLLKG